MMVENLYASPPTIPSLHSCLKVLGEKKKSDLPDDEIQSYLSR